MADTELTALIDAIDWLVVTSGETVLREGEPGDALYAVLSGRLSISVGDGEGNERIVREVGRSSTVGELALVTREPRTATVRAVRDSLLGRLSREAFEDLVTRDPSFALSVTRVIAGWLLPHRAPTRSSAPATILVLPVGDVDGRGAAERLAVALGATTQLVDPASVDERLGDGAARAPSGSRWDSRLAEFFDAGELEHSRVLYLGDLDPSSQWNVRAVRQVDCVLVIAAAATDPGARAVARALQRLVQLAPDVPRELVLLHRDASRPPAGTRRWLDAAAFRRHEHVRTDAPSDWARLARHLTGTAVGLVLSGGGARGFAHIGALRAFEDAGIEIDRVGGTSMGACIGALWACGYSTQEIIERSRRLWLGFKPLQGYTVPLVSLLGTRRSERGMADMFGERRIEDLWRDYFCTTTNLTRNVSVAHRSGLLRRFVLASMSIPGVAAPLVHHGELLVDGGVLNNLPTDLMRAGGAGTIIAVDVSRRRDFAVAPLYRKSPSVREFLSARLRGGRDQAGAFPGIVRILERTAGLASEHAALVQRQSADVLFVAPPLDLVDTFDMRRMDDIVEIGYDATREAIEHWPALLRTVPNRIGEES